MKPFNLERALAGDPVVMRNGQPVELLRYSIFKKNYPLYFLTDSGTEDEIIETFSRKGKFNIEAEEKSIYDLFMASKKRTVWINILKSKENNGLLASNVIYGSEIEAKNAITHSIRDTDFEIVGTYPIEVEE